MDPVTVTVAVPDHVVTTWYDKDTGATGWRCHCGEGETVAANRRADNAGLRHLKDPQPKG